MSRREQCEKMWTAVERARVAMKDVSLTGNKYLDDLYDDAVWALEILEEDIISFVYEEEDKDVR